MFWPFNPKKATQAAAVVMRHCGKRVTRLRLLKLLYIADRTAIKERGHPIVGGEIVAMDDGPLHSPVYDLIKGRHLAEPFWSRFITVDGPRDLVLSDEPENDLLSEYEIDLLSKTTDLHDGLDDYQLVVATHSFGEWIRHHVEDTSKLIPMESIVEAVYDDPTERAEVLQELKDKAVVDGIFARATS